MPAPDVEALRPALLAAAVRLDVPLQVAQANQLLAFIDLLQRWNATYNLTSIREPSQMLSQHVVDCLAVIGPLRAQMGPMPSKVRLLDVGSGGGLPGVVIAVMCPDVDVVCVDAVGKKSAFVRQVAAELTLANLRAEHSRVESLDEGGFNVVVSRAFASLKNFAAATCRQLEQGGVWMAMKGRRPDAEIAELSSDVSVFHVEHLDVPGLNAERCLVWMRSPTIRGAP